MIEGDRPWADVAIGAAPCDQMCTLIARAPMTPPPFTAVDRDHMLGLEKGLAVIACFGAASPRLTIAEVAKLTGLTRATARRCLITLTRLDYAETDGRVFSLTPKVLRLGYAYLSATPLPQTLQRALEGLSAQLKESCSAAILDGSEIVYVARAQTKRIMAIGLGVGARLPAFCTSLGRVLLAALPPDDARRRLEGGPRKAMTRKTKTSLSELEAVIAAARVDGYAAIDEELEIGLCSIAVPVYDSAGRVVAALNVGAQTSRLPPQALISTVLPELLEIQQQLRMIVK